MVTHLLILIQALLAISPLDMHPLVRGVLTTLCAAVRGEPLGCCALQTLQQHLAAAAGAPRAARGPGLVVRRSTVAVCVWQGSVCWGQRGEGKPAKGRVVQVDDKPVTQLQHSTSARAAIFKSRRPNGGAHAWYVGSPHKVRLAVADKQAVKHKRCRAHVVGL